MAGVEASGAVFEAKFMLPWSFSEEAAAEKHMPQLQHNMWVIAARSAVLSIITGGGKWVEIKTHADPLYQHLIVTAERKFWRCVENGEPPALFGVDPPKPRIEAVRIVDMSSSNAWAEFAGDLLANPRRPSRARTGQGRTQRPGAGGCATGDRSRHPSQTLEIRRHQFRSARGGGGAMQRSSESIGTLAARSRQSAGRAGQSGEIAGRHHPDGWPGGVEQTFRYAPLVERARDRTQDLGPARDRHRADDGHRSCRRH